MRAHSRSPLLISLAAGALVALAAPSAFGASTIRNPRQHIDYVVELEPHLNFGFFHYRDDYYYAGRRGYYYSYFEFGGGFRASIPIMDPGFVRSINDNVAITFGGDITGCASSYCNDYTALRFPVGVQWNFFFTKAFNAFGEAGFSLGVLAGRGPYATIVYPDFFLAAGLRVLFSDSIGLTVRFGYPFLSVGVSFFL
jgi:hypothetical protein